MQTSAMLIELIASIFVLTVFRARANGEGEVICPATEWFHTCDTKAEV